MVGTDRVKNQEALRDSSWVSVGTVPGGKGQRGHISSCGLCRRQGPAGMRGTQGEPEFTHPGIAHVLGTGEWGRRRVSELHLGPWVGEGSEQWGGRSGSWGCVSERPALL